MEGTRAAGRRPFMPASRILEGSLPERHPKGPDLFWRPTTTQNGVRAGYQGRSPCLVRPLIDDPNSAEFERISNKYKAAVAKSKPLLEETYNDRNPNRFSESRKQPSLRDEGN